MLSRALSCLSSCKIIDFLSYLRLMVFREDGSEGPDTTRHYWLFLFLEVHLSLYGCRSGIGVIEGVATSDIAFFWKERKTWPHRSIRTVCRVVYSVRSGEREEARETRNRALSEIAAFGFSRNPRLSVLSNITFSLSIVLFFTYFPFSRYSSVFFHLEVFESDLKVSTFIC